MSCAMKVRREPELLKKRSLAVWFIVKMCYFLNFWFVRREGGGSAVISLIVVDRVNVTKMKFTNENVYKRLHDL